ncbi:hypothetical protein BHM03_00060382, partial [Ensete ventricosum]
CPNPSCPICVAVIVAAAPTQATTALPVGSHIAPTPVASVVAPASGRAGRGLQPLVGALQPAPFTGVATGCARGLAAAGRARKRRPCELLPLRAALASLAGIALASSAGLPCGLALVATWPWVADPAWGLAVVDCPSSSLPSL